MMDAILLFESFTLNPWAIPSGLAGLSIAILSIRTLMQPERVLAQTLGAAWGLCAGFWLGIQVFVYCTRDAEIAIVLSRMALAGCIIMIPLALDFADAFLGRRPKSELFHTIFWLFAVVFSLVGAFTDLIFSGVNHFFWGFYPKFGPLGPVFLGYALVGFAWASCKHLFSRRVHPFSRADRFRRRLVRIGVLLANFAAVDSFAAFGFAVYPFGWLGVMLVVLCAEYAQRHGLWRVEQARQESQILEAIDEGVLLVEKDFDVYFANRTANELFHLHQRQEFSLAQATNKVLNENIHKRILGGHSMPLLETVIEDPTGEERTYSISSSVARHADGRAVGVIYVFRDTTAFTRAQQTLESMQANLIDLHRKARDEAEARLRKIEDKLVHVAKIEALGLLAGGVAHDFNNLLTAVLGGCDLVLNRLEEEHPGRREIMQIRAAGEQGAKITQQLLSYSRKQPMNPRVFDVNQAVSDATGLLRSLIPENVEIAITQEARDSHARAEPGQIVQVVINLAINARDAMPSGGRLTIRTENVTKIAPSDLSANGRHEPHKYVAISVSDTGIGMDNRTLSRIFDPFFTTKEAGRGTGLGLSTAYGMVHQIGGDILVESELGKGSTFHVLLPVIEPGCVAEVSPTPSTHLLLDYKRRILVVEDHASVRSILAEVLATSGFCVLEASDGDEASRILQAESERIALVITDVMMRGMGGRELAAHIAAHYPEIKVIAISGYLGMHDMEDLGRYVSGVLAKPFGRDKLLSAVHAVLFADGGPAAGGVPPPSNRDRPSAIA